MSISRTVNISCPSCGTQQDVTLYDSINIQTDPELKDALMQNQLNRIHCEDCDNLIIRENIIRDNGIASSYNSRGVNLQGASEALIEKNVISANTNIGISASGNSAVIIRNNIIVNNGEWGIVRSGTRISYIVNNVIDQVGGVGIGTDIDDLVDAHDFVGDKPPNAMTNLYVAHNRVSNMGRNAIIARDSDYAMYE